jgi:hypothetical protein
MVVVFLQNGWDDEPTSKRVAPSSPNWHKSECAEDDAPPVPNWQGKLLGQGRLGLRADRRA